MNWPRQKIIIGTRGSELALQQTGWVRRRLQELYPQMEFGLAIIRTQGDRITDVPLHAIGDKGLFIREIEQALLERRIDLAVHSLKDLPSELAPGLALLAVTEREDPRDVLVSHRYASLDSLPLGARVGTSSLRRAAQLKRHRPDLEIVPLRGNLDTRLKKLQKMDLDGIILAAAGLRRMGWEGWITEPLDPAICLPAVGQGALALEGRDEDGLIRELSQPLNHWPTFLATAGERAFLQTLGGGCQVPIAALGTPLPVDNGEFHLRLDGLVASTDGSQLLRSSVTGPLTDGPALGRRLAEELLAAGAREILSEERR